MWEIAALASTLLLVLMIVLYRSLWRRYAELRFRKGSLSSKYGRLTEQFFPFLKDYPHDPQGFRFIGSPVDGVQFDDDRVVFVEFKAAGGKLTDKQKRIKELVEKGKVGFEERRVGEG
jgi:predicted Holliday junction resolvase-like endonuclease